MQGFATQSISYLFSKPNPYSSAERKKQRPLKSMFAGKKNEMIHKYNIFINYFHHDSQLAESIYSKLNDAGMHCFLAEKGIVAAERWEDRIRKIYEKYEKYRGHIGVKSQFDLYVKKGQKKGQTETWPLYILIEFLLLLSRNYSKKQILANKTLNIDTAIPGVKRSNCLKLQ